MTKRTLIHVVVPTVGLAIGFVAVALADQSLTNLSVTSSPSAGSAVSPSATPSPQSSPQVTVNGRRVDTKDGAATTVPVPGGTATVKRSGPETTVETNAGNNNTTSITGAGEIYVNASAVNANGTSFSTSNISSSSSSSSGNQTSLSTSVYSTGTNGVVITP